MANRQGTPIWFEHTSDDPARAQACYEAVAGWRMAASADPGPAHREVPHPRRGVKFASASRVSFASCRARTARR